MSSMRSSVGENGRTYLHISNYSDINPPIDIEKSPLQALVHALKDDGSFRSCGGKYVDLERSFNATKDFNQDNVTRPAFQAMIRSCGEGKFKPIEVDEMYDYLYSSLVEDSPKRNDGRENYFTFDAFMSVVLGAEKDSDVRREAIIHTFSSFPSVREVLPHRMWEQERFIEMEELIFLFHGHQHPDVRLNRISGSDALQQFLVTFEVKDGHRCFFHDFCRYYRKVSACYTDTDEFLDLLHSTWDVTNVSRDSNLSRTRNSTYQPSCTQPSYSSSSPRLSKTQYVAANPDDNMHDMHYSRYNQPMRSCASVHNSVLSLGSDDMIAHPGEENALKGTNTDTNQFYPNFTNRKLRGNGTSFDFYPASTSPIRSNQNRHDEELLRGRFPSIGPNNSYRDVYSDRSTIVHDKRRAEKDEATHKHYGDGYHFPSEGNSNRRYYERFPKRHEGSGYVSRMNIHAVGVTPQEKYDMNSGVERSKLDTTSSMDDSAGETKQLAEARRLPSSAPLENNFNKNEMSYEKNRNISDEVEYDRDNGIIKISAATSSSPKISNILPNKGNIVSQMDRHEKDLEASEYSSLDSKLQENKSFGKGRLNDEFVHIPLVDKYEERNGQSKTSGSERVLDTSDQLNEKEIHGETEMSKCSRSLSSSSEAYEGSVTIRNINNAMSGPRENKDKQKDTSVFESPTSNPFLPGGMFSAETVNEGNDSKSN